MSTIFCNENDLFQSVAKKPLPLDMYESNLLKFLPCNDSGENCPGGGGAEEDSDSDLDPYSSDHFRMYEFKIRRCTRSRSHDWTDCPFSHPGEKARRRDPRKFHYSGAVCPEFRRGGCSRGDNCEFAHGVFEYWLHPSRYRTEACKDGRNCKRKVCFFAHTPRQLRLLPEGSPPLAAAASAQCSHRQCCCSVVNSPTSILAANMYSPPLSPSPPVSPVNRGGGGGFARLRKLRSGVFSRKDVLNELMNSLEAMSFSDGSAANTPSPMPASAGRSYFSDGLFANTPSPKSASAGSSYFSDGLAVSSPIAAKNFSTHPWIDCNPSFNGNDQLINLVNLSPNYNSAPKTYFNGNKGNLFGEMGKEIRGKEEINKGGLASFDPDLGWVNELLM